MQSYLYDSASSNYYLVATFMVCRGAMFAAATLHMNYNRKRHKVREAADHSERSARPTALSDSEALWVAAHRVKGWCHMLIPPLVAALCPLMVHTWLYLGLNMAVSHQTSCVEEGSPLQSCLQSAVPSAFCIDSLIIQRTADVQWDNKTKSMQAISLDYSYSDEWWSMRPYGPVGQELGCLSPRAFAALNGSLLSWS